MVLLNITGPIDLLYDVVTEGVGIVWIRLQNQLAAAYRSAPAGEDVAIHEPTTASARGNYADVIVVKRVVDNIGVPATPYGYASAPLRIRVSSPVVGGWI